MLKKLYQTLKKSPFFSKLLHFCDITVPRKLQGHLHPLYVRLISNHWVRSGYEQEIREVFKQTCRLYNLKTLYDIGSNVGIFALDFLSLNPKNSVFAFEPNPFVFPCLEKTRQRNQLNNLQLFNLALSDLSGKARLTFDPLSPAKGGLHPIRDGKYNHELEYGGLSISREVKTVTLDNFFSSHLPPDILKIDAEGEELRILKGARKLLSSYHPVLFFECSHNAAEIHKLLISCGYSFKNLKLEKIEKLESFNLAFANCKS
ncbi:MAG: FkbM family methyltransferase [Parachlamydiales bacterium]|jgi:FkbM family methyltransferase